MFRILVAYILVFSLTFQSLGSLGVWTWFGVNRSYIAEVLCENRDKPAMHCDGQCVLMKKLKNLDDVDRDGKTEGRWSKVELLIILPNSLAILNIQCAALMPERNTPYTCLYTYLYSNCLFIPPKGA